MLETQIKLLIKVIEENTKAILNKNNIPFESLEQPVDDIYEKEIKEEITIEQVKELSKKKLSEGIDRKVIKEIITELGGESIVSLDQESLNSLYEKLKEM